MLDMDERLRRRLTLGHFPLVVDQADKPIHDRSFRHCQPSDLSPRRRSPVSIQMPPLIELGVRFDAALTEWRVAHADWKNRQAEFDAFVAARTPKALRWQWRTDAGMPFVMRSQWTTSDLYSDDEVERIRSRQWDIVS